MGRRCVLPPLTREQQARAAGCFDRTRNAAYHFARRRGLLYQFREVESDAMIGLTHAARSYDPARNDDFFAFSTNRIIGAMLDGIRDRSPLARSHRAKGIEPPKFVPAHENLRENGKPPGFDLEQEDQVAWMLRELRDVERHVIRRIYVDGAGGSVIGRELGVSPSRVSQLRKRALGLLHARFRACAGE